MIRNTCIDPSAVKETYYYLANCNPSFGGLVVRVQALVRGNISRKTPLSQHAAIFFASLEKSVENVDQGKTASAQVAHVEIRPGAVRVVKPTESSKST